MDAALRFSPSRSKDVAETSIHGRMVLDVLDCIREPGHAIRTEFMR